MNIFRSKWMIVGALALTSVFAVGFGRSYIRDYNINKEIGELETVQQELEKERSQLSALLKRIQSTAFAEEQAREQFGLRKPGEKSAVIKREDPNKEVLDTGSNDKPHSNPYRWWLYFFAKEKLNTG